MTELQMPPDAITAGELREMGAEVPSSVPDYAWVPRSSMRVSVGGVRQGGDATAFSMGMELTFTEPFRWVHGTFSVSQRADEVVKDSWENY